jgi:hypothetical protein
VSSVCTVLWAGRLRDDDVLVVWIELHRKMTANEGGELIGLSRDAGYVPYARRLISARSDYVATVWAICRAPNNGPMALELYDQPSAFDLPHSRGVVGARGEDEVAIGAVRCAQDAGPMPLEFRGQPPAFGVFAIERRCG